MALGRAEPRRGAVLSGRHRFLSALAGQDLAFAPIVWEALPALVHQDRADWWRDPTIGQRLIADTAALAGADAMFVFAADEAVRHALAEGERGDAALDGLASTAAVLGGVDLVRCLREVAEHAVVAAVPAPAALQRALGGVQEEAAEDAFTDLCSAYLEAGADAVAIMGEEGGEVGAGVTRAARLAGLYGRPLLGVAELDGEVEAWDEHGEPLGVISADGTWPGLVSGVVITPGDVSARWDAARLRSVGAARPAGTAPP
jgi:hypothetical protein